MGQFQQGRVRIWFFGFDWFQIAAIVKWPLMTRLLGEGQRGSEWILAPKSELWHLGGRRTFRRTAYRN
jgi:hypothetical protein